MYNPAGDQPWVAPQAAGSEFNSLAFVIGRLLGKLATITVVRVVSCTNSGGVSPVGTVSVQPLVNQVDGAGQPTPHGVLYALPYFRLQGGANAVIIDPVAGDLGLAAFASRDISIVTRTKAQANPGSHRRFDMADGLYIGGFLNGTPTQYVAFQSGGIAVTTPGTVTVNAPLAQFNGDIHCAGTIDGATITDGGGTLAFLRSQYDAHVHGGVTTGGSNTSTTDHPA